MGFGFPDTITSCLIAFMLLLGTSVSSVYIDFSLLSEVCQMLLVHSCRPLAVFVWFFCWSWQPNPELGGGDPWKLFSYPGLLFLPGSSAMWDSSKHVPEENEICSDEVYNCDLDFCFALLSQDLEFRLVITARKTALELQSWPVLFMFFGIRSSRTTSLIGL